MKKLILLLLAVSTLTLTACREDDHRMVREVFVPSSSPSDPNDPFADPSKIP